MTKNKWMLSLSALLLAANLSVAAGPLAGCFEVSPPGTWAETQAGVTSSPIFEMGDDATYSLTGATLATAEADPTGDWDWVQTYTGGTLILSNLPAAKWYSPCTGPADYLQVPADLQIKLRSTRFESTNAGYQEFELVAESAWITFRAAYAGTPDVEIIPETPETVALTVTSGAFNTAEVCIGQQAVVDIRPGSRVNPLNVKSRGVVPVAIRGTSELNVRDIDPSTLRLQCVAPVRWAYEDVCRDGIKDLVLKFDTQALVSQLPSNGDRETVTLVLTGQLRDGTPISGEDHVIVLNKGKPAKTPPGHTKTPPGHTKTPPGQTKDKTGKGKDK